MAVEATPEEAIAQLVKLVEYEVQPPPLGRLAPPVVTLVAEGQLVGLSQREARGPLWLADTHPFPPFVGAAALLRQLGLYLRHL